MLEGRAGLEDAGYAFRSRGSIRLPEPPPQLCPPPAPRRPRSISYSLRSPSAATFKRATVRRSWKPWWPAAPGLIQSVPSTRPATGIWLWPTSSTSGRLRAMRSRAWALGLSGEPAMCREAILRPATVMTALSGRSCSGPQSMLPRTAVTGAMRSSSRSTAGSPTSPAWTMRDTPAKWVWIAGSNQPCVSAMRPMAVSTETREGAPEASGSIGAILACGPAWPQATCPSPEMEP